ncbi:MAG: sel1 repeat family protein [Prevotella sp.]|nr:sel1 repeat family protein [Prevotella sp.]
MKKTCLFLGIFLMSTIYACAQSLYTAKSYIEQGRYLDAAKQLRPLADGGNAEAQYLAAELFFEGKGVQKNDLQGLKYAKLSADQGNENAVYLLSWYYSKSKNFSEEFAMLKKYTDRFPNFLDTFIGYTLALDYYYGHGTEKNIAKAWELFERTEEGKKFKTEHEEEYNEAMPGKISYVRITNVRSVRGETFFDTFNPDDRLIRVDFSFTSTKEHLRKFWIVIASDKGELINFKEFENNCVKGFNKWWMNVDCPSMQEGVYYVGLYENMEEAPLAKDKFFVLSSNQSTLVDRTQWQKQQFYKEGSISTTISGCEAIFSRIEIKGNNIEINCMLKSLSNNLQIRPDEVIYSGLNGKNTSKGAKVTIAGGKLVPNRNYKERKIQYGEIAYITAEINNIAHLKHLDRVRIKVWTPNGGDRYIYMTNLKWQ